MDSKIDLVTIRSYFDPHQASIDKALLESNDIVVCIEGTETATALSYIGSAVARVLLRVDKVMAKKAIQILDTQAERLTVEAWVCNACGSDVDEGFEVCWSCGAHYDAARRS